MSKQLTTADATEPTFVNVVWAPVVAAESYRVCLYGDGLYVK
jgi:hypothetical protein